MLNAAMFKVILVAVGVAGAGFAGWGVFSVIKKNGVLEASLESTTAAFGEYAGNVEAEVYAYSEAVRILSNKYQDARDERDGKFASIENRDLDKMARNKPEMLARILNGRTSGLLNDLSNGSRASSPEPPSSAEAGTD